MIRDFRHFFEDKNRLIDRLNLTDDQKEELKAFFKRHPNYESKIDWNNKSLQYKDFEEVLALEGNSENSKKKYGLSGQAQVEDLEEGKDYLILAKKEELCYNIIMYYPLTFKASEVLAKPSTPPEGITGKWCISGRNYSPGTRDQHWKSYTGDGTDFFFVFTMAKEDRYKEALDAKFAISRSIDGELNFFNSEDEELNGENDFGYDEDGNWYEDEQPELDPALKWAQEFIETRKPEHVFAQQSRYTDERGVWFSKDRTQLEKCPGSLRGSYQIPEGTEWINSWAFADTSLSKIEIPDSVEVIETCAFYNARFLTQVSIGNGVKDIEDRAFKGCSWLKEITLPDSVTEIGRAAFMNCQLLQKVKLPANLTELTSLVFANCQSLSEIELPKTLRRIEGEAFFRCQFLKKLSLPPTTADIAPLAFRGSGITELEFYAQERPYLSPITGFTGTNLEKIIFHGTEKQFQATMPVFFNQLYKQDLLAHPHTGVLPLPWGCQVYCTEDNKTLVYTKPNRAY